MKKYHLTINYPVSNTVHTFMPVCQYSLTSFVLHIWSHYVGVFRVCVYCLGSRYILQFSGLCIWLLLSRYKLKDCTANIYDRITIKLQPMVVPLLPFPGLFVSPQGHWFWILILQFFPHTDTDTYAVFFRLSTETDTSVFEICTGYWIHTSIFILYLSNLWFIVFYDIRT